MVGLVQTTGSVESALTQAGEAEVLITAPVAVGIVPELAQMATAVLLASTTVASPVLLTLTVVGVPEVQVTELVTFCVLPSL